MMKKNSPTKFLIGLFLLAMIPFYIQAQYDYNNLKVQNQLGIGISSPLSKLHIVDGTGVLRTTDNGDGIVLSSYDNLKSIGLSSSGNGNYGGTGAVGLKLINGDIRYYFEGIEKMTFQDDGRVGIGTSSPAFQLHMKDPIGGAALGLERSGKLWRFDVDVVEAGKLYVAHTDKSNVMVLSRSGNVGIGTTNPLSNLHVEGDMRATRLGSAGLVSKIIVMGTKPASTNTIHTVLRSGTGDGASFNSWNGGLSSWFGIGFHSDFDNTTRGVFNTRNGDFSIKGKFSAEGAGNNYFAGNVGIGTTNHESGSKLTVAGKIHSREVKVTVNAGADHVFEEDFHLPNLEKLETFIKENKHLPEIAPEKEMLEKGVEVGEFQMKLLQKVEELTLYIINQNKLLKEVMQKNEKLEDQIEELLGK